jgi:multiple sugar transport system substrate-binding protein
MTELELSLIEASSELPDAIQAALNDFEAQRRIHVRVRVFNWSTAWSELVRVALHKSGPDVSEIGTTWVDSFTSMSSLRPFSRNELSPIGGQSTFLPASWASGSPPSREQMWSTPWMADTRAIYYRRDLLHQAGIDEQSAFQSPDQLTQTLDRLQEAGVTIPWLMPTAPRPDTLHTLASWVWGAGGHFTSDDGRRIRFNEPEARAGIRAYFGLHRYMAPGARNLTDHQANRMYCDGKAAILVGGYWVLHSMRHQDAAPEVIDNTGMALVPGIPFVGGSNLAIWDHTRRPKEALELVRFLSSQPVQATAIPQAGLLPVRLDVLNEPPFTTDPLYQVVGQSLKTGRGLRATYLWGLAESKLVAALNDLWADTFAAPTSDQESVIANHLEPLAQVLDRILSGKSSTQG